MLRQFAKRSPPINQLKKCYASDKVGPIKSVKIYRYNPNEQNSSPTFNDYSVDLSKCGQMYLDLLEYIKSEVDPSISYRRSCREGICGSCAMNINGENKLACQSPIDKSTSSICVVRPLPHMFVMKDLITDLRNFAAQYQSILPYLINKSVIKREESGGKLPAQTIDQSPVDREKINGLYDCILCACCSTGCPSYWWNSDKFLGPAALLQAHRWIADSRDDATRDRLKYLNDKFKLYKCQAIMNCTKNCPKGLKPSESIAKLKLLVYEESQKVPQLEK